MTWAIPSKTITMDIPGAGTTRFRELSALDFARFVDQYADLTGRDSSAVELVGFYLDLMSTTIDEPELSDAGPEDRLKELNRLRAETIVDIGQKLLHENGMLDNGEQKKS